MGKTKTAKADAQSTERRFSTVYYRYDGNQRGSLFDRDGEPLGRVQNGTILEVADPAQAARLEAHGHFTRTTKAKYVEQQHALGLMDADGSPVAYQTGSPLDPNLNESGTYVDAPTGQTMQPAGGDTLTSGATATTSNSTTGASSQGGNE